MSDSLDPIDCSPPSSSVQGISRQEYWSGLPFSPPGESPQPSEQSCISCVFCIGRQIRLMALRFLLLSIYSTTDRQLRLPAFLDQTPATASLPHVVIFCFPLASHNIGTYCDCRLYHFAFSSFPCLEAHRLFISGATSGT